MIPTALLIAAIRWDFGLDNPNKAAIPLACILILLAFGILRARHTLVSLACTAFAIPIGYAFLRTLSRGGFVALSAGLAIVILSLPRTTKCAKPPEKDKSRPLAFRGLCLLLLVAAILFAGAIQTGFAGRLANSNPSHDASIGNRLVIWHAVPQMMLDAPGGWGLGNAGGAFMSWYQPLSRHERYRTLVSSHLTWLVEFSWFGRWLYLAGWMFAICIATIRFARKNDPLPLALALCLATGASFSSVAEDWRAWPIPAAFLLPAVITFISEPVKLKARAVAWPAFLALITLFVLTLSTQLSILTPKPSTISTPPLHLSQDGQRITVGNTTPSQWIVFDSTTMGGKSYGRALRSFMATTAGTGRSFGIAKTLAAVPNDVRHLALCGVSADAKNDSLKRFRRLEELRVLSPKNPSSWLTESNPKTSTLNFQPSTHIAVICGDLSSNCPPDDAPNLKIVPGAGDYLPTWPQLAFASLNP